MMKWILVVVLVLAGFGAVFGSGDDDAPSDDKPSSTSTSRAPDVGDEIGAQVVCRQFVERRLKAPSTADYSGEAQRHVGGPVWIAVGDVDAENSFGAPMRNRFMCKLRHVTGDRYRLVSFQMG